jgi:hypothetical protein
MGAENLRSYLLKGLNEGLARVLIPEHLIGVTVGVPGPFYSSARAATSSRQKSGMSGTTRPQTEWRGGWRHQHTSPTPISGSLQGLLYAGWCAHGCTARPAMRRQRSFRLRLGPRKLGQRRDRVFALCCVAGRRSQR